MTQLGKTISHALRHEPWLYGLTLDEEGWTDLGSLLDSLRRKQTYWSDLCIDDVSRIVTESSKRRYEIRDGRIRATYGHSVAASFEEIPGSPPNVLFHGTSPGAVLQIRLAGLVPMRRQYVHLSTDEASAFDVGRRKSKTPIVIRVLAKKAAEHGSQFYRVDDTVWLTNSVRPEFIDFRL